MEGLKKLIVLQLVYISKGQENLRILYEWTQLDYQFPSAEARQQALDTKAFIPLNNIPMGLEAYGDRLFVTVPRWRNGVPASLNYINLKDNTTTSPKLIPYPNWAAHSAGSDGKPPEIISPFRVRIDRCSRLWVLDSGHIASLEKNATDYPPFLVIYDLKTDNIIRKYVISVDQVKIDSSFANIAVEDWDCHKSYAYVADIKKAGLVVYSWEKDESWRINHHYFNIDPLATDYNINGFKFDFNDALFGIALSAPDPETNYSTLYFHPMTSFNEFSVSTKYLRSQAVADNNFNAFKLLGSRGPNTQSSASFLDPNTGVLFYSLVNLNAIACWSTSNKDYTRKNQGRIHMDNATMIYATDIKVDYHQNLWIISNRLPFWFYLKLNSTEVNFRIFTAPVLDAISHTVCDVAPRLDILDEFANKINIITDKIVSKIKPNSGRMVTSMSILTVTLLSLLISVS